MASRFSLPPWRLGYQSPGARVVEIEHRGHRVDAQPVHVADLEPEIRAGEQEALHLVAPVIEDQRAPLAVLAQARVLVFVECAAVEAGERVIVAREVAGHPVDEDADAGGVAAVDQMAEILEAAPAAGGREIAGDLIAPGAGERMLAHRHQLDMGEAQLQHIGNQLIGELPVIERVPSPWRRQEPACSS